ncbi:MAG TPA: hypothetical protein VLF66_04700, partial [Thermoanaerobaculia bacterium]|nr:hypothetical protein [Thermoanaerobaculia bacterium]
LAALLEGVPLEELRHPGRFLQPLPSPAGHPIAAYQELVGAGDAAMGAELRGMFLLVGEASDDERFDTPTGERLGVEIHADAVQALRTGSYLRRVPPELTLGVILVLCYLVAALVAAGAPAGKLVKVALGGSAVLVAGSALATWAARLWVDVIYGLVAVWLLLMLLLALRRLPGFAGVSRDGAGRGGASP